MQKHEDSLPPQSDQRTTRVTSKPKMQGDPLPRPGLQDNDGSQKPDFVECFLSSCLRNLCPPRHQPEEQHIEMPEVQAVQGPYSGAQMQIEVNNASPNISTDSSINLEFQDRGVVLKQAVKLESLIEKIELSPTLKIFFDPNQGMDQRLRNAGLDPDDLRESWHTLPELRRHFEKLRQGEDLGENDIRLYSDYGILREIPWKEKVDADELCRGQPKRTQVLGSHESDSRRVSGALACL